MDHIENVGRRLCKVMANLGERALNHDASTLKSPEKEVHLILKGVTPGSAKYKKLIKPALEHHYKKNRHHPEHHKKGIKGMSLLDLIEMLCDQDNLSTSAVKELRRRYKFTLELQQIILNTVEELWVQKSSSN